MIMYIGKAMIVHAFSCTSISDISKFMDFNVDFNGSSSNADARKCLLARKIWECQKSHKMYWKWPTIFSGCSQVKYLSLSQSFVGSCTTVLTIRDCSGWEIARKNSWLCDRRFVTSWQLSGPVNSFFHPQLFLLIGSYLDLLKKT